MQEILPALPVTVPFLPSQRLSFARARVVEQHPEEEQFARGKQFLLLLPELQWAQALPINGRLQQLQAADMLMLPAEPEPPPLLIQLIRH